MRPEDGGCILMPKKDFEGGTCNAFEGGGVAAAASAVRLRPLTFPASIFNCCLARFTHTYSDKNKAFMLLQLNFGKRAQAAAAATQPPAHIEDPYPSHTPTEQICLLRLDVPLARAVKAQIAAEGVAHDLRITWTSARAARIHFRTLVRDALLVDLPCIVEAQKTIDRKQFYKVADVAQMLLVVENGTMAVDAASCQSAASNSAACAYKWPHGVTAPLQNVRSRRFRAAAMGALAGVDIEEAVERLLQADDAAVDVHWDVVENADFEGAGAEDDISDLVADIEYNLMDDEEDEEDDDEDAILQEEDDDFEMQLTADAKEEEQEGTLVDLLVPNDESAFYAVKDLDELDDAFQLAVDDDVYGEDADLRRRTIEESSSALAAAAAHAAAQQEILDLEAKCAEKTQQLAAAPPNPIIRRRLEMAVEQLQAEIAKKRGVAAACVK